ncbi:hypothetical protein GMDG_04429 [Pseudogymnoascus destructans 20631-21]|uniref:Uncharacterized protein n=1 Tax=Pseudogymnoascus destructans (strain ATCC MYA-4855 / 20631-21) TaxID=658429 RepID=L8GAV6_PSED2|nr:hypothetical protein GMDG_04429 [Pseudogymnoascus destructans 20631-21]
MSTQPRPLLLVVSNNNASDHPSIYVGDGNALNSNFYQCQFRRPPGALSGASRVLCLRCLWAKASGVKDHDCVWSPASSKCEYCTAQHSTCVLLPWFLGEEYRVLFAAEVADPWDPAAIEAAAAEANWVALVAAQSVSKFSLAT